jgi:hypothetical protein
VAYRWIQKNNLFQNRNKKYTKIFEKTNLTLNDFLKKKIYVVLIVFLKSFYYLVSYYITCLIYNAKISDNNAESGKVPRMLAAVPR